MELDRALELAVMSSWNELVNPGEPCSIHVEYENVSGLPLSLVEVWTLRKRGYGILAFRYVAPRTNSLTPHLEATMSFANSYHSDILAGNLDFIMRNQSDFTRPPDHSIHGLVQIESPNEEAKESAALWRLSIQTQRGVGLGG